MLRQDYPRGNGQMCPCPDSRTFALLYQISPPSSCLQFPLGRRAACDIYWHGVSFHDNDNVSSGQVNKFPGKPFPPQPLPYPTSRGSTI